MNLLQHQVKYAKGYKDKGFLVHEFGTGKTVCACVWLRDNRDKDALVVCPKRVVEKWKKALKDWETKATVVSKEQFKKLPIKEWSAKVIDEADEFASPLFTKNRSQLATAMYELTKKYPEMPTLLLTATPIRSNPYNLHTLLTYLGEYIDHKKWRDEFFSLQYLPYLPRPAWMPKKTWRTDIRPILEKHADIVLLKDCVTDVPPITEIVLGVESEPFKGPKKWESTAGFVEEHRFEQINKAKSIIEIGKDFRKVLVVAYYVEQIKELEKQLSKDRETFAIYGGIKNQEEIIKKATESDECFFIVQASLGVGFDASTYSCVVFASMAYGVRNFLQMKGRVRRINDLHPVTYYYLQGGRCDKAVRETIESGRDFVPSEYLSKS